MKINAIKSIAASLILAALISLATFQAVIATANAQTPPAMNEATSYLASPLLQGSPATTVTVQAASGMTITFHDGNSDQQPEKILPHLVLHHEDGRLTPEISRTIVVTASDVVIPPNETVTVTVLALTHNPDPSPGSGGSRILAWTESQWITNTQLVTITDAIVTFTIKFADTIISGTQVISTPTDYFQMSTRITGSPAWRFDQDYAFLMENQATDDLGGVYKVRVNYCDMFPVGGTARIPRKDVENHVRTSFIPMMQDVYSTEVITWGVGAPHSKWDTDGVIELFLGNGAGIGEWYHKQGGQLSFMDNGARSIAMYGYTGGYTWYPRFEDGEKETFGHEFFHTLQFNLEISKTNSGDIHSWWPTFIEGQANSVEHALEKSVSYFHRANEFLTEDLNLSYNKDINPRKDSSGDDSLRPYQTGIFWRFLFEQGGGLTDPAQGMAIIKQALEALYDNSDGQTEDKIVDSIGGVLDNAFSANGNKPFATYRQSLISFARANYALLLDGGRNALKVNPPGPFYYDPGNLYVAPPSTTVIYTGTPLSISGEITPSFGMDFVNIDLDPSTDGLGLRLEFSRTSAADFNVDVWPLKQDPAVITPTRVLTLPVSITLTAGSGEYFIPVISTTVSNRLGLIITRLDNKDLTDPGTYIDLQKKNENSA